MQISPTFQILSEQTANAPTVKNKQPAQTEEEDEEEELRKLQAEMAM